MKCRVIVEIGDVKHIRRISTDGDSCDKCSLCEICIKEDMQFCYGLNDYYELLEEPQTEK